MTGAEFERAIARALGDGAARALIVPARTAIVADPREEERVAAALPPLLSALRAAGALGGGTFVLAAAADGRVAGAALAARWRAAAGLPVVLHDPSRSPCCALVRDARGEALELDDELREAEAIVLLGGVRRAGAAWDGGSRLIVPGLSRAGAAPHSDDEARAAALALGVDLALLWSESHAGALAAWCAPGLEPEDRAREHTGGA